MAIFFSLLYLSTTYLSPTTVFGDLGQYHLEQVIAALALIASLAGSPDKTVWKLPQTLAIGGMIVCVALSMAFNGLWFAAFPEIFGFTTTYILYFFVLWNFRTLTQIRILVAVLVMVAIFIVHQGASAVHAGNQESPYVMMMGNSEGSFYRIRGLALINDPNDLCQFLVGLIPCVFLLWSRGKHLRNTLFVLLPVSYLLYGMFLTHSRGGMLGLLVALIVLGRRKFGILPAVVTGGVLFVALTAVGWTGGRDISAESGADRTEAWSVGLTLIRTHPLFGVGFRRFAEYYYITAHNTVVVCAAEIGIIGFFFWTLLVVPTFVELTATAVPATAPDEVDGADETSAPPSPRTVWRGFRAPALPVKSPTAQTAPFGFSFAAPQGGAVRPVSAAPARAMAGHPRFPFMEVVKDTSSATDDELRWFCGLMTVAMSGFFAAGWFLSRSYTNVFFVNMGLALAVHRLAVERGIAPPRIVLSKAAKYSGIATVVLIAVVYAILRSLNFMPK